MMSALTVSNLHKAYAGNTVLAGVDLTLAAGEVLCVLGPNGAGKTTLISTLLGLVKADSGEIQLLGEQQQGVTRNQALRQQLGVMMQIGSLSANLSVFEQCDLFSSYYPQGYSAAELVQLAGLAAHAQQRFGRLSGGQKQRLLFALALAGKPRLVFLDEPTLGMDVEARQALWQQVTQLRQQGVAVVLTTHYLEEAEQLADSIAVLHQGQIVAKGSPSELKALMQYKVVRCHSQLTDAELMALPAVIQFNREQQYVTLHSRNAEHTVRALLQADQQVSDLEVRPVALEQAFLHLTQNHNTQYHPTKQEQAA